jgi:hypothetical protein
MPGTPVEVDVVASVDDIVEGAVSEDDESCVAITGRLNVVVALDAKEEAEDVVVGAAGNVLEEYGSG